MQYSNFFYTRNIFPKIIYTAQYLFFLNEIFLFQKDMIKYYNLITALNTYAFITEYNTESDNIYVYMHHNAY